jgi:DNA-binding TFAR19-related protein (PDSD5 family)
MRFKDNVLLPNENNYTLDVNQEGTYTVEVTTVLGCSRIRTIKVTASDIASITSIDVVDLADTNTVTVNVTEKEFMNIVLTRLLDLFKTPIS